MDQASKPQEKRKRNHETVSNAFENAALATSQHPGPQIKRYEKGVFQCVLKAWTKSQKQQYKYLEIGPRVEVMLITQVIPN